LPQASAESPFTTSGSCFILPQIIIIRLFPWSGKSSGATYSVDWLSLSRNYRGGRCGEARFFRLGDVENNEEQ